MRACPYCGRPGTEYPGDVGTCGNFACLYRHFCGGPPPAETRSPHPLPWNDPQEARRIALLRPGQLGDLLLAVPGLRALRRGFPEAEITLIAQPWAADLFGRFGYLDRILPLEENPRGWDAGAKGAANAFLREARSYGYDLVLQLQADAADFARLALAMGGRATAGFCRDEEVGRAFHLLLSMSQEEPEILRPLRLAHALGIQPAGVQLEFPLLPEDWEEVDAISGLRRALQHPPVIALHPGARSPARRWPLPRFVELARLLHHRWGATLLTLGGSEEIPLGEEVREGLEVPVVNLAGKLSPGGLAALLAQVDLFVGNDSGPAQLAAATAPRSLRIFGPANRRRWAPLDRSRHRVVYHQVECSPCEHWECPIDHRCLKRVGMDEVMREVELLLQEAIPAAGHGNTVRLATRLPQEPPPGGAPTVEPSHTRRGGGRRSAPSAREGA